MAETFKNITDTLIIPKGSQERFVLFSGGAESENWFGNGVLLSGLSDLKKGYLVVRPDCNHHFAGLCLKGSMGFRLQGKDLRLTQGQLLFLRAGELHHYWAESPFSMLWWHLDRRHPRWIELSSLESQSMEGRKIATSSGLMEMAFEEAQSPFQSSDRLSNAICGLILALLERDIGIARDKALAGAARRKVEAVWKDISADPSKPWSVENMARRVGMSKPRFHAIVKECIGKSPMTVVRGIRIERAKALLRNGQKLEVVAEMTGYDSPFSLSRAFKKCVGTSPRSFMKKVRFANHPAG